MFLALISSANANNDVNSRSFTANTNNSASNANTNIGAHLMQYYYKNINLAAWQKITNSIITVLVAKAKIRNASCKTA
jgi:hypothetical protein